MYGTPETPKELLSMSTIHMMTTSHSLYLPTMLATHAESDSLHVSKGNEVELQQLRETSEHDAYILIAI